MSLANTQLASTVSGNLQGNGPLLTTPETYTALDDFLTGAGAYNRPDVRELLVKTYGDQGITGFLQLTGAIKNAGTADQVEYFEEKRRHQRLVAGGGFTVTSGSVNDVTFDDSILPQKYDVLMKIADGERFIVDFVDGTTNCDLTNISTGSGYSTNIVADDEFVIIGNMYPQGSNQPGSFQSPDIVRRKNPFMIVKEKFEASGSQATNIGYINVGNGDYRWFMYGEQEARARFMDKREMMMLFANQVNDLLGNNTGTGLAGSEGYFSAVEARGNIFTGSFTDMNDVDTILLELDKQGAPNEYAMYLNRQFSLDIDDLLAQGIATQTTAGLAGQFGAFNNDPNMAVQLGFKSFTRGGYTFHKHDWKLLNDPTLLAGSEYKGAMVPMSQVSDPRSGAKSPALEMNYKSANGYDRELNHWVTGGDVLGYTNNGIDGKDVVTFNYRSECNLVTRAANQHVVLKG